MFQTIEVDDLSQYTTYLKMGVLETGFELAVGTGFFYEDDNYYYLVTNAHNVTGVHPEKKTKLSNDERAPFPTVLSYTFRVRSMDKADINHFSTTRLTIPLYSDDEFKKPVWFMHPNYGHFIDVVAIVLGPKKFDPDVVRAQDDMTDENYNKIKELYEANVYSVFTINTYKEFEAEPKVSDNVFILGYPFGITDENEFPIWKRGSIATEPDIFYEGFPRLLIDTATRPGMSGSPVILTRTGVHFSPEDINAERPKFGTIKGFVGIYSGRHGDDKDAQLGIVWRKEVIADVIAAKVLGNIDFQSAYL